MDVNAMVMTLGGRHRTRGEWDSLAAEAGLAVCRVAATVQDGPPSTVLELRRAA